MHLTTLANMIGFIINFTWIFFLSVVLLTLKTIFMYVKKMFDLPVDVILAMREIKAQDESKNKKVQKQDTE
jgi:hypothetical protein